MINRLWQLIGIVGFWAAWPLLFVYLYFTARTRVLVVAGEQVLVVKGWLSTGAWDLPGGGLHRHETADAGVMRELHEETGIDTGTERPQLLYSKRVKNGQRHSCYMHAFVLILKKADTPKPQRFEMVDTRWMSWRELYNDPRIGPNIKEMLAAWFKP